MPPHTVAAKASPQRERAWLFAHKLIALGRLLQRTTGADMLDVSTAEICKAMRADDIVDYSDMQTAPPCANEEVKQFVYLVLEFIRGYDMNVACGCGYLSLKIATNATMEELLACDRDIRSFAPDDLDNFFVHTVLSTTATELNIEASCDVQRLRQTTHKI